MVEYENMEEIKISFTINISIRVNDNESLLWHLSYKSQLSLKLIIDQVSVW